MPLFCYKSPPFAKAILQKQPISPKSAPKKRAGEATSSSSASKTPKKTTSFKKVTGTKTLKRQSPPPASPEVSRSVPWPFFPLQFCWCACTHSFPFLQTSTASSSGEKTQSDQGDQSPTASREVQVQKQPDAQSSASRKRPAPKTAAPRASVEVEPMVGPKRARIEEPISPSNQEILEV